MNKELIEKEDIITISGNHNNLLKNEDKLNLENNVKLTLSNAYHVSEIKQNDEIVETAKKIIWIGFSVIIVGIIFALFDKIEIARTTIISGTISEFISGTILAFVTISNKSKLLYFKQLSITEEGEKLMNIIMLMDNKKAKENMIDKMVTNYCDRRKE